MENVRPLNNLTAMRKFFKSLALLLIAKIILDIIILLFIINIIK